LTDGKAEDSIERLISVIYTSKLETINMFKPFFSCRHAASIGAWIALAAFANVAHAGPTLWIDDVSGKLGKIDVETGVAQIVGQGTVMSDIAFSPDGQLFGVAFNSLYKIDATNAQSTFVGNLGTSLNSLVFAPNGTLYGANNSLYTINPSTGAASLVGNGGDDYQSSGDLAFVGSNLYLTSLLPVPDSLTQINQSTGAGTTVAPLGIGNVFGSATDDHVSLFGVTGTNIYAIDASNGVNRFLSSYAGQGLGAAYGTSFFAEAIAPIPEPSSVALMGLGLAALAFYCKRRRSS
jgi:hypothetical protein